jgi:hypothetical protein
MDPLPVLYLEKSGEDVLSSFTKNSTVLYTESIKRLVIALSSTGNSIFEYSMSYTLSL